MRDLTDFEYKRIRDILSVCSEEPVFVFEKMLIKGYKVDIVKEFVIQSPSSSFYMWLIDKGLVIQRDYKFNK